MEAVTASFVAVFDLCRKLQTFSVFAHLNIEDFCVYQPAASFPFYPQLRICIRLCYIKDWLVEIMFAKTLLKQGGARLAVLGILI